MTNEIDLETIKNDLQFQLQFGELDWDYFIETAERARSVANDSGENFSSDKYMQKHDAIPERDGMYWYIVPGEEPEPVLINHDRYGNSFKGFDNRRQSWLKEDEYLIGPQCGPGHIVR